MSRSVSPQMHEDDYGKLTPSCSSVSCFVLLLGGINGSPFHGQCMNELQVSNYSAPSALADGVWYVEHLPSERPYNRPNMTGRYL